MKNKIPFLLSVCCISTLLNAQVIFQDNFNSYTGNPNGKGWNADNMWNTANVVSGAGPDGSNALRITFNTDQLNRWCNYNPSQNVQEFFVKFNFKTDCLAGNCAGGAKFLKIFGVNTGGDYANTTLAFDYNTPNSRFIEVSYGATGRKRDTDATVRFNGTNATPAGAPMPVISVFAGNPIDPKDGKWHTMEFHMKYNDDSQNNGLYEVWYDGILVLRATGVNNRDNANSKYVSGIQLGGWNQNYAGNPYYIYYDNVIVSTSPITGGPSCGGPDPWTNTSFTQQTGTFTADLDVTPSGTNIDGVVGLSNAAAATYTDLACIVRFNTNGNIDARNGASYQAVNTVPYTTGINYHMKMDVNIGTKKYDMYVTPQGGSQQIIASQYDFRTEQNTVSQLNNWAKNTASCSLDVKNFTSGITTSVKDDLNNMFLPFTVYPNPFSEFTVVDFSNIKKYSGDNLDFYLYNLLGEEVAVYTVSTHKFILERNNLNNGVYLYKIMLNEKYIGSGKLIIQ